jgi:hypothetical protein
MSREELLTLIEALGAGDGPWIPTTLTPTSRYRLTKRQCAVEGTVTAAIEAMPGALPAAGLQWCHSG